MSCFQHSFVARSNAVTVRFGPGVRHRVAEEIAAPGASRALILSTAQQAAMALAFAEDVGDLAAGVFPGAAMHTPVEVTGEAMAHLGKAIAYRTDLPQIVVPKTMPGSEATAILGQTEGGKKSTLTDARVQPEVILYDAELMTDLPVTMTVTSALNPIAHAAEGLYARDRNPLSTALAVEGMRALAAALPRVIDNPSDLDARGETLYGAWLCGTVLGQVGMALHHKLCHTLGGSFGLPHAETHAIILPHAIAYNAAAVPELLVPVTEVFGGTGPGEALYGFATRSGAALALRDLGLSEGNLERAAGLAIQNA